VLDPARSGIVLGQLDVAAPPHRAGGIDHHGREPVVPWSRARTKRRSVID
jgi:hypothetical protein